MSSSIGNCIECPVCGQEKGFVCRLDGDFITTGEWARLIEYFDIHGVSFNQKIDSVRPQLDVNTIQIMKVLICESNRWDYSTSMEIIRLLDEILSRLSTDNKDYSYIPGDDAL